MHQSIRLCLIMLIVLVAPIAFASEAQLTEGYNWFLPSWSPDGHKIAAYARDGSGFNQIYLVDVKTELILWRTESPGNHFRPRFSPSGEWVVYECFDDETGKDQLFKMHVSGGEEFRITESAWNHSTPRWSPDESILACTVWQTDGPSRVAIINTLSGEEEIMESGSFLRWFPEWSPDGTMLAYYGEDAEGFPFPHIFVMDLASRISTRLTSGMAYRANPRWSPDGEWIVYEKSIGAHRQVMKISAHGGEEIQLTRSPYQHWNPVWSPDGEWIAYSALPFGGDGIYIFPDRLFMISENGGDEIQLTLTSTEYDRNMPSWSPDGAVLAYTRKIADPWVRENPQIHLVPTGVGDWTGNVNGNELIEEKILSVNDSYGGFDNPVRIATGENLLVRLDSPPQGPVPAGFVLYASKGSRSPTVDPRGLGVTCFPTPISGGSPVVIANSLGHRRSLGQPTYGVRGAPVEFNLEGIPSGTWQFQAFIRDNGSRNPYRLSTTNAVTVKSY